MFVTFGYKKDGRTGKPLFNEKAWRKADNILKEILLGWYSDPPDWNFITTRLTSMVTKRKTNTESICFSQQEEPNWWRKFIDSIMHNSGIFVGLSMVIVC
jgi:hypothetical protein